LTLENEVKPPEVNIINNPLTDININDFNTMQKLFQTNNFNEPDMFNFSQPSVQPQSNQSFQLPPQTQINQQFPSNENA